MKHLLHSSYKKVSALFDMSETNLLGWQLISLVSRGIALFLGIVQSFFIVRILSVGEWGLVQIAASVGGALGIYQHLGLASGSTREISAAKDDTQIFRVFVTSLVIRYLITLPLAFGLFFFAKNIAVGTYNQEVLVLPLKLYAIVLIMQGAQSILNSVISGTKRFKRLFLYQALVSIVSIIMYVPFVMTYRINGFFYAMVLFNLFSTITLTFLALGPLKTKFALPNKHDFMVMLKDLLSISLAIYFVKILYTQWEKSGPLLLGLHLSPEVVGIFAFAMLYGKKIVNVSDAITDVNLPVFSDKYVHDFEKFKELFMENFDKVFCFIILGAFTAIYWAPEAIHLVVGSSKYDTSLQYILPITFAFVFYSFINIIKSSVIIPAKMVREMILTYVAMLVITAGFYLGFSKVLGNLTAMSYGMLIGSLSGLVVMVLFSQYKVKFKILDFTHILIMVQAVSISLSSEIPLLSWKILMFVVYLALYICGILIAKFVTKKQLLRLFLLSKK